MIDMFEQYWVKKEKKKIWGFHQSQRGLEEGGA